MSLIKYDGSAAALTLATSSDRSGADGADTLTGTAANDGFWGGQGDRMVGGAGDDTYYLQGHKTQVVEAAGEGTDKIVAWANVYLGDHPAVENLTVGGDGVYGAGNALDNVIEGQAGAQQLYGGHGQDVLIGGAGADVFIVHKGQGSDVIQDFAAGEDKVRLKSGFTAFDQVKAAMSQVGGDVKLDLGGGEGLVFRNTSIGQFGAGDFQLELDPSKLGARTFADEFSGQLSIWDPESNPTGTWRPDFGYQGVQGTGSYTLMSNDEKQIYTSPFFRGHNGDFAESPFVSNADGTLSIWARPSTNGEIFGYGYTSGFISTKESHSQTYGYFEMRADIPSAVGAWPAFWMIPTDGSWPPELDVMETLTYDPRGTWTTEHSAAGGHTAHGQLNFTPDSTDGFHTYGALWSPTEIVWYVDNVEVFRQPTPADMNKPMFMIANLAMGGWGGPIDASQVPAEFKIDYIRAWGLGDGSSVATPAAASAPAPAAPPTPVPAPTPATASAAGQDLNGTAVSDVLMGGSGNDRINGGDGLDYMRGGEGDDIMSGGGAFDDMHGNQGQDTLAGNDGDDWVVGGKDADRLFGDEGGDVVLGNMGADVVDGGAGDDVVRGGQDDDQVFGWAGADWISGDRGADTVQGGSGGDTFHTFAEAGVDLVLDFNFAEGDRVQLLQGATWSVEQAGGDTIVHVGEAQLVLQNVQLSSLGDGWLFGA